MLHPATNMIYHVKIWSISRSTLATAGATAEDAASGSAPESGHAAEQRIEGAK